MNFSEFTKLMHKYIGTNKSQQEFLPFLFGLIMHEPISDKDIELDEKDSYYPFVKTKSKDTVWKIYSGSRNISVNIAKFVNGHFNKTNFIDAIYELDDDAKEKLCNALSNYGISCTINNVDEVSADVFGKIIEARADGKDEYAFHPTIKLDLEGKKVAGISLLSAYCANGKIYINGETINLPIQLIPQNEIAPEEQPYISALCDSYADALGQAILSKEDVDNLPKKYKEHFKDQRKCYYSAESIQRSLQEVYDDGKNQFDILKDDAYEGIKDTYWGDYSNGYERLRAVLDKVTNMSLDKSTLIYIKNLIGNLERKGICHILVNDKKISSWVNIDD